jgi:hypothetical protein
VRKTYLAMIKACPGGWDVMAASLGMSRQALENRVYERKGQCVSADTALQMQKVSGTSLFAEASAQDAGGVFMKLPEHGEHDNDELLSKFNDLYIELGDLSGKFKEYTKNNDIDIGERRSLEGVGQHIHRTVEELLALTFRVFCKQDVSEAD